LQFQGGSDGHLRSTGALVKFLSMEPLLGPTPDLNLVGIDWVIVGGESGPGARPMLEEWVVGIKEISLRANVPFFFKQWGGVRRIPLSRADPPFSLHTLTTH
jgi:protein gp37